MSRTVLPSVCPLDCPDLCSLAVTVENGRVTHIDGTHLTPITGGTICGKVRKFADHLYGPDRIRKPLLRTGPKGSGQFREASWDEALSLVAERLASIRDAHGGDAIVPCNYGGSNGWLTEGALASRFFYRLGATRIQRTLCAKATGAAALGLYGAMPGVAIEDFEHAKLIVVWGTNPSHTGLHAIPFIKRATDAGARLVVIDPRRTPLAKKADLHLAIRPGTDLPVALAIANALFEHGSDEAFLREHVAEVDEFRKRCAEWSIERAASEAGIAAADLQRLIDWYRSERNALIRCGWGTERNRNGGSAVAAILALPAIAGKFGLRGSGFTMSNSTARWAIDPNAAVAAPAPATRVVNMSAMATALRELISPKLHAIFVYNNNPIATIPAQAQLIEQFKREDLFVVVHEQVMTDSAMLADVVLPATTFLEHREVRRGYGAMRLYDARAVVTPEGEARSNNQVFGELMQRMSLVEEGDIQDEENLVDAIFASHPDGAVLRKELDENGVALPRDGATPIPFVDVFPRTSDGKVHLVPKHLDAETPFGLYHYQADPRTETYPLALISPALGTQISSMFGQLRRAPAEFLIHPDDASARGITDGANVRVFNGLGTVEVTATVTAEIRAGVVLMAKGYWRKHTANGFTANALIPEVFADLGGQAAFNDARVDVVCV